MMSEIMQQRSDGTWGQSIPEPLWVRPWRVIGPWRPQCCGIRFLNRDRYQEHYAAKHFTKVCGDRKEGYFCAKTAGHYGGHQSCGGVSWASQEPS